MDIIYISFLEAEVPRINPCSLCNLSLNRALQLVGGGRGFTNQDPTLLRNSTENAEETQCSSSQPGRGTTHSSWCGNSSGPTDRLSFLRASQGHGSRTKSNESQRTWIRSNKVLRCNLYCSAWSSVNLEDYMHGCSYILIYFDEWVGLIWLIHLALSEHFASPSSDNETQIWAK